MSTFLPGNSRFLIPLIMLGVLMLFPDLAAAQTPGKSSVAEVLCTVYNWLAGPLGAVIGMAAVIVVSLMAMFGRIQLPTVLVTMAGLALIFGSQSIVQAMGLQVQCTAVTTAPDILSSPIYHIFSCIVGWFTGPLGKALATLAIIALGAFALYGKVSYQQALIVALGIASMFGAFGVIQNMGIPIQTTQGTGTFSLHLACTGSSGMLDTVYCSMINWFNGPFGKALATVAIIVLGLGALYGKVSWGLAIIAGVGVGLIFGGTTIVSALGGPGDMACAAMANAGQLMSLTGALCNVINWFNGPVGKGVATLAVIILGLGALFGKVSWTMTLVGIIGIALVFGATSIVSGLGGIGNAPCPTGDILKLKMPTSSGSSSGSSTSSSTGSTSTSTGGTGPATGVGAPGTDVYFGSGNQNKLIFPGPTEPGTLTIDPYESVMIPAGTKLGDTVQLGNGWTLIMPSNAGSGKLIIPDPSGTGPSQEIEIPLVTTLPQLPGGVTPGTVTPLPSGVGKTG